MSSQDPVTPEDPRGVRQHTMRKLEIRLGAALRALDAIDAQTHNIKRTEPSAGIGGRLRILELDTEMISTIELVRPEQADIHRQKFSILSPLGSALLGARRGDMIEIDLPGRAVEILVLETL